MQSLATPSLPHPALLALGGNLAIAASAQIQEPMTLQGPVVLLVGVALLTALRGSRHG